MTPDDSTPDGGEPIPLGQKVFDHMFLLLAVGITFPLIFYFAWGLLEIFVFNNAQLSEYLKQTGLPTGK